MSEFLLLCLNFFKTGLFAVGGGLATLPFLSDMASNHPDWFTQSDLANIIAISESTPGPIGINMATYAGYMTYGVLGGVAATLSLVFPSFVVIIIVERVLEKFKSSRRIQGMFNALRPASVGLILGATITLLVAALFPGWSGNSILEIVHNGLPQLAEHFSPACGIAFLVFLAATQIPKLKDLHPILFILAGAAVGILFAL